MYSTDQKSIHDEIIQELHTGACLGSVLTRAGGACTFVALMFWIYGVVWATQWIKDRVIMQKVSMILEHGLELPETAEATSEDAPGADSGSSGTFRFAHPDGSAVPSSVLADRQRPMRSVEITDRSTEFKALEALFTRYLWIQGSIQVIWLVVMILAGVFMLCASIAGLAGSVRSRGWHRQVVYWALLATACTICGLLALARWGGFPPIEDPWILAKIAAVQSCYGIAVLLALLIVRRPARVEAAPSPASTVTAPGYN